MKILKVKCLAPTRLDNYLMQQFPALNPGRLNKALRENKIKLNGKKQPLSTRVMAGDEIKLFILDDVLDADKRVDGPAWKNARGPAQVVCTTARRSSSSTSPPASPWTAPMTTPC